MTAACHVILSSDDDYDCFGPELSEDSPSPHSDEAERLSEFDRESVHSIEEDDWGEADDGGVGEDELAQA
eukprot:5116248-Pleurochrysis_carterae.AAC.1